MIDLQGPSLSPEEQEKIHHPNTGAVILFSRNFIDSEQITALIQDIRAARKGDILIAVDQEGGRVQRFQQGFTRLPPADRYGRQHAGGEALAESAGWLMAAELLAVGVDFSFAPVLDVDCGISSIIGDRAFSRDCQEVARIASRFRKGMQTAGMAAVGKHFPGHGGVALDSHLALPCDDRDLETLRSKDLLPFQRLIDEGLRGIMPAHVVYPAVDSQPAGFSRIWIQHILRLEMGFDGAVFSDDLSMAGAAQAGDFVERARLAELAGCDMLLVCNNPDAAAEVLDAFVISSNPLREHRLQGMLGETQLSRRQLLDSPQWQQTAKLVSQLTEEN